MVGWLFENVQLPSASTYSFCVFKGIWIPFSTNYADEYERFHLQYRESHG
jgi:hypothetical protein